MKLTRPIDVPMDEIRRLTALSTDQRVMILVGDRKSCQAAELRARIRQAYPAAYVQAGRHYLTLPGRKSAIQVRFVYWPRHSIDPCWAPDVVIYDQDLPMAPLLAGRDAARSSCLPW